MLGVGAKKTTYMDDVFSTYLYKANNGNTLNINNGIDLAGEGGMTWIKCRDTGSTSHSIYDTVRGVSKLLWANHSSAQLDQTSCGSNKALYQFNNNGFTLGGDCNGNENWDQKAFSSWTFRKAPGFFTIKEYTGTGSSVLTLSHDLGSVPGMILIKRLNGASADWIVYHRSTGISNYLKLNSTSAAADDTGDYLFNNVAPTATHFTIGAGHDAVNANTNNYIAYLFAGGESTAATARSVDFDGSNDYLSIADHADFDVGTNWTAECWFKCDALGSGGWDGIFGQWTGGYVLEYVGTDLRFYYASSYKSLGAVPIGQWHHVAISKEGSTTRIFLNGTQVVADFDMGTTSSSNAFTIGGNIGSAGWFNGKISNVRIVQGTAVYTSSFRPPTEPLTNITNTKLLCCNDSSQTGSTVTPGTITNNGSTASTDSPFDDPAAHVFGESGSESVIKTGSYIGNGSDTGPEINLGWEPQWILLKRTDSADNWAMYDVMRGITTGGTDNQLRADQNAVEHTTGTTIDVTSTGFKITTLGSEVNANNGDYVYICIRRPDGYCGKLPELGTDVFAMDAPNSNTTGPIMESPFPVDFGLLKVPTSLGTWYASARLIQGEFLETDSNAAGSSYGNFPFDYQNGWVSHSSYNVYQSWMFKRHAGFDVVCYEGDGVAGRQIAHNMNKTVEMLWLKNRSSSSHNWMCYHKGLNGGTNPEDYRLRLNTSDAEGSSSTYLNSTAPTSTHITLGSINAINADGNDYIGMLFSSISGISKLGHYSGSSSDFSIDLGFTPRLWISKRANGSGGWIVFDTLRGMSSSVDDPYMYLNSTAASNAYSSNSIDISGNTITLKAGVNNDTLSSSSSDKFIYYAHA